MLFKENIQEKIFGNSLVFLIGINILMFIVTQFVLIVYFALDSDTATTQWNTQFLDYMNLPSSFTNFFTRPWTILTYTFVHSNVFSLISLMLWLWFFGFILNDLTGNKILTALYLQATWLGGFVFLIFTSFLHSSSNIFLSTASIPVLAIASATTTLAPKYRIFPMLYGGIPIWVVTLIFYLIQFASIATSGTASAIAHLLAGALGFFFMLSYKNGNNWGAWMQKLWIKCLTIFDPKQDLSKQVPFQPTLKVKYGGKPIPKPNPTQSSANKLDEILDKINRNGLESLLDAEKDFLKKMSES